MAASALPHFLAAAVRRAAAACSAAAAAVGDDASAAPSITIDVAVAPDGGVLLTSKLVMGCGVPRQKTAANEAVRG